MEAEQTVHKKLKKKKKNKNKCRAVELPDCQTCEEVRLHQEKHKRKKKAKGMLIENDSSRAEVHGDTKEEKFKRKTKQKGIEAYVQSVVGEFEDNTCQESEEMKKRKKRKKTRIEETVVDCIEMTRAPSQTNDSLTQASVKGRSKRKRKQSHTSPATDKQPHLEKAVRKSIALPLNIGGILQELKEYLPGRTFTNRTILQKVIRYDLPRFREFKEQGVPVRSGRFTVAQNNRLKQNVKDFLALSGIESATKLFQPHRFPEEKEIIKLKRKLGFITCLCAGIPRPWDCISLRARQLFSEENFRFTEKENKDLLNLYKLHGRKWRIISDKMGRCKSVIRSHLTTFSERHGPWTQEEFRSLLSSVLQQLLKLATPGQDGSVGSAVVSKVDLYKRLPWTAVSKLVPTRSWRQCRVKWMTHLIYQMKIGGVRTSRKELESEIHLIKAIYEMDVEDTSEIEWDDLTHLFGNTPPQYLQTRFHRLKVSQVPNWNSMTDFCEIVDYLYEKTLPKLEEKLRNCMEDEEPSEERDSYKLSEIFPDI